MMVERCPELEGLPSYHNRTKQLFHFGSAVSVLEAPEKLPVLFKALAWKYNTQENVRLKCAESDAKFPKNDKWVDSK